MADKVNVRQTKNSVNIYFAIHEETETPKMKQNPNKSSRDYFHL